MRSIKRLALSIGALAMSMAPVAALASDVVAREIQSETETIELGYVPYDWSLNGAWVGARG